jgi:hypothetical protein
MRADRPDEMMKLGAFFHPTGNHVAAWLHPEAQIESHEILEVAGAEAVATAEGNMEEEGFEPSVPLVSRGADPAGPSRRARGRRSLRDRLRRFVARINSRAQSAPRSDIYVRRTYSGRPSSSMRFRGGNNGHLGRLPPFGP